MLMVVDMGHMNKRRHFCCHVVHQVLMFDVPDMPSPRHVAPRVAATFDINRRSRRDDGLDPMVRARSCPQVQVGGGMGQAASTGRAEKTKPTARVLAKTAIRNRMGVLPQRQSDISLR